MLKIATDRRKSELSEITQDAKGDTNFVERIKRTSG
jgi:hypothetical protein